MNQDKAKKPLKSVLGRGLSSLISSGPVPVAPHRMNTSFTPRGAQTTNELPTNQGNLATAIPDENSAKDTGPDVQYLNIDKLIANPKQPRQDFDQTELEELANSIKALGLLQPILVRPSAEQVGKYEIVAGERRWRASKLASLPQVPVIIHNIDDVLALEIALVENVQRSGLNPIEEATTYERLISEFNLGQKEVAEKVGKDRTTIANAVRLLKLPSEVQQYLKEGAIQTGHAKAILTVKEPSAQISLAKKVIDESLSVRALESIVARVVVLDKGPGKSKTSSAQAPAPAFPELIDRMRNSLGTKVSIKHKKTGSGKIEIEYFSESELERIIDIICKN